MREIEFRIRYRDKSWYYGVPLTRIKNNTVAFQSFDGNYYDLFADATTLGQYTGLKDKNGKKIFEGDIFGDSKGQEIDVVVFEDGCFKLKSYGFIEYCLDGNAYEERWGELECEPICNFCLEHDEVLGNIYDNPELLGGSNESKSN